MPIALSSDPMKEKLSIFFKTALLLFISMTAYSVRELVKSWKEISPMCAPLWRWSCRAGTGWLALDQACQDETTPCNPEKIQTFLWIQAFSASQNTYCTTNISVWPVRVGICLMSKISRWCSYHLLIQFFLQYPCRVGRAEEQGQGQNHLNFLDWRHLSFPTTSVTLLSQSQAGDGWTLPSSMEPVWSIG